jgi:hypothetical protein
MATYTGSQIGVSNSGLGDLAVLLDGTITSGPSGTTTVTYGNDPNLPGVTVQLIGTGISGSPSSGWNISQIVIENNFGLVETITGITGVDGTPTTGSFDAHSLFQAEAFRNAPRLIFDGNNNTINGGPGNESLFGYGKEGNTETINANGSGNYLVGADGGMVTVNLGAGHDVIEFNAVDSANPTANVTTVHGFNVSRDVIDLNALDFVHLSGTPHLIPSEFHIGANPVNPNPHDGIWYNPHTGALWYDFFTNSHGEVKDHVATIFGHGATHPALTAADFFVIA